MNSPRSARGRNFGRKRIGASLPLPLLILSLGVPAAWGASDDVAETVAGAGAAQIGSPAVKPETAEAPKLVPGTRVVLKNSTIPLRVGDKTVARSDHFRVYQVQTIEGPWVWITTAGVETQAKQEFPGAKGWVKVEDIVPFDSAIDYFTRVLETDPSPWVYDLRGLIWDARGEHDRALDDFDAALKLAPSGPTSGIIEGTSTWHVSDTMPRSRTLTVRSSPIPTIFMRTTIVVWPS